MHRPDLPVCAHSPSARPFLSRPDVRATIGTLAVALLMGGFFELFTIAPVGGLAAVLTIWGIAFIWIIAFGVARISDELRRRRLDALRDIADARAAVKDEPPYLGTWRGGRFE